jgi:hypothetical protein
LGPRNKVVYRSKLSRSISTARKRLVRIKCAGLICARDSSKAKVGNEVADQAAEDCAEETVARYGGEDCSSTVGAPDSKRYRSEKPSTNETEKAKQTAHRALRCTGIAGTFPMRISGKQTGCVPLWKPCSMQQENNGCKAHENDSRWHWENCKYDAERRNDAHELSQRELRRLTDSRHAQRSSHPRRRFTWSRMCPPDHRMSHTRNPRQPACALDHAATQPLKPPAASTTNHRLS